MASYHYVLRGFSPRGSVCVSGVIKRGGDMVLDELIREIEKATGEILDPALSNAVLMVNDSRVDWDTGRKTPLQNGDRLTWITPAFGG